MNDTQWERVADAIDIKFGITDHGKTTEPLPDKPELNQTVSFICFTKEGQQYRLERIAAPAIVDRKSIHGRSASAGVRFENVYDPGEITYRNNLLVRENGEWQTVDLTQIGI